MKFILILLDNQENNWSQNIYNTLEVDMNSSESEEKYEFKSNASYDEDDFTLTKVNLTVVKPSK